MQTTVQAAVAEHNAANEIPASSPAPVKPVKWTSTAGPIQTKRVKEALDKIRWEANTYTEKWGIIGGEEHAMSFTLIFGGGGRADCHKALGDIADRFAWTITAENHKEIIAAAVEALAALVAARPVTKDTRRTPDQEAQYQAELDQANAARELERVKSEMKDPDLGESWSNCVAEFRGELHEIARKAGLGIEEVFTLWKRYADQCVDQSAILSEFLEWNKEKLTPKTATASGASVRYNQTHDGVEIRFPEKPDYAVISRIKCAKFRWSSRSRVWYRRYSDQIWRTAHELLDLPVADSPKANGAPEGPDRFDMQVEDNMAAQCGL